MNIREGKRKMRMGKMGERIKAQGEQMEYEKEVAWAMMEFGVSRRTAKEYIDPILKLYD